MGKPVDLVGRKFGRLTILSVSTPRTNTYGRPIKRWLCLCDCGGRTETTTNKLVSGHTQSCGCYATEQTSKANKTHGMRQSHEYVSWASMKSRCLNPRHKKFDLWGGRGIKICDEWLDSFDAFYCDMGPRPAGTTLDRIDANGPYAPGNCRWATPAEQANNLTTVRRFTVNGVTDTISGFAARWGCSRDAIKLRLRRGQTIEHIASVFAKS
jgi:hypothetical protein